MARHAMAVYDRATKAVLPEEQYEVRYNCILPQKCPWVLNWDWEGINIEIFQSLGVGHNAGMSDFAAKYGTTYFDYQEGHKNLHFGIKYGNTRPASSEMNNSLQYVE